MSAILLVYLVIWASPFPAAQAVPVPVLHRRYESQSLDELDSETASRGKTTLPLDASGQYSLGQPGEVIEIELQPNSLSGYISRSGDGESDQGAPLTFFFASSVLHGAQFSFNTRQVHGVRFSFEGTIVRGDGKSKARDGYYRLQGQLTLHDELNHRDQTRAVSLPMSAQYGSGE